MRMAILLIKTLTILPEPTFLIKTLSTSLERPLLNLARLPRRNLAIKHNVDFLQRLPRRLGIREEDVDRHNGTEHSENDISILAVSASIACDLKKRSLTSSK